MKKVLLLVTFVCIGFFANAQLYVGGGLGFNTRSVKPDGDGDKLKENSFNFSPEIGYSLNDKMDVGLELTIFTSKNKTDFTIKERKTFGWNIAPYFRYSVIEFKKFKVLGKGSVFVAGDKTTIVPLAGDDIETKSTTFGLNIVPMITYDISEKFVLFTDLNFLAVNLSSNKVKDGNSTTRFNFGVNADDLYNVGAITVGFAYKF